MTDSNKVAQSLEVRRIEQCTVKMMLKNEAAQKHAKDVKLLCGLDPKEIVKEGDDLWVTYEFLINYFGDVVSKLSAVNRICKDPDVVLSVDCELLEKSKCLVFEVLNRLMQLRQTIEKR